MSSAEGMAKHQYATDYFALFGRDRRPWLDPDALKEKYEELILAFHPDRAGEKEASTHFATITEAYRVLSDHKLRLQHLLGQEGAASQSTPPEELADLFLRIGSLLQKVDGLVNELSQNTSSLGRALLRPRIIEATTELNEDRELLQARHEQAELALRKIDEVWNSTDVTLRQKLSSLAGQFAYLKRWQEQLSERHFQLSVGSGD